MSFLVFNKLFVTLKDIPFQYCVILFPVFNLTLSETYGI